MRRELSSILEPHRERDDRVAVWCSGVEWTYRALDDLVSRLAAGLRQAGFGPRTLLATILENRIEQLALHLAAFRLGIPLVRLNANYAVPQILYCLRRTLPAGLIAEARISGLLADAELPESVRHVWSVDSGGDSAPAFAELLQAGRDAEIDEHPPEAAATITFTSGTTARPKGVIHSRAALGWAVAKGLTLLELGADEVVPVRMPIHYQIGLLIQTLPTLIVGGRVELLCGAPTAAYVAALQRPPRKTLLFDSPTVLMDLFRQPEVGTLDLGAVRRLLAGGDFVPARLRAMARELAGLEVSMAYGLTEAGLVACQPARERREAGGSVGFPLPETQIRIVGEAGVDAPRGEAGQVFVRTASQMSQYWMMPELTESVLTADGWIATGDLGSLSVDGELLFHGRLKEIIVRDSSKISPIEVEAALLAHPGVRQAAVVGVSDAVHGEEVQAFVVLRENFEPLPSESDVRCLAAERLAPYMVPERVRFVARLPYHPSGKLDRAGLRLLAELNEIEETLG